MAFPRRCSLVFFVVRLTMTLLRLLTATTTTFLLWRSFFLALLLDSTLPRIVKGLLSALSYSVRLSRDSRGPALFADQNFRRLLIPDSPLGLLPSVPTRGMRSPAGSRLFASASIVLPRPPRSLSSSTCLVVYLQLMRHCHYYTRTQFRV